MPRWHYCDHRGGRVVCFGNTSGLDKYVGQCGSRGHMGYRPVWYTRRGWYTSVWISTDTFLHRCIPRSWSCWQRGHLSNHSYSYRWVLRRTTVRWIVHEMFAVLKSFQVVMNYSFWIGILRIIANYLYLNTKTATQYAMINNHSQTERIFWGKYIDAQYKKETYLQANVNTPRFKCKPDHWQVQKFTYIPYNWTFDFCSFLWNVCFLQTMENRQGIEVLKAYMMIDHFWEIFSLAEVWRGPFQFKYLDSILPSCLLEGLVYRCPVGSVLQAN